MIDYPIHGRLEKAVRVWRPEARDEVHFGNLSWSGREADLSLFGGFGDPGDILPQSEECLQLPVLHGTTIDGECFTMLRAFRSSSGFASGPAGVTASQVLRGSLLCLGEHVGLDSIYAESSFDIPGLLPWLGHSPIESKIESAGRGAAFFSAELRPSAPEIFSLRDGQFDLRLGSRTSVSDTLNPELLQYSAVGCVNFVAARPQPLGWHLEQFASVASLLNLLAGVALPTSTVRLRLPDTRGWVYLLANLRQPESGRPKQIYEILVSKSEIAAVFPQLLASWFELEPKVRVASRIGLDAIYGEQRSLSLDFLSLIHSLEGIHRSLLDGKYMPNSAYQPVAAQIIAAIPNDLSQMHIDSLKSRIRFGNELSLRRRLNDLAEKLGPPLAKLLLGGDGRVPQSWIDTRNYFSHWEPSLLEKCLGVQQMADCCVRLGHFVRATLLLQIGFSSQLLHDRIQERKPGEWLRQINARDSRRSCDCE